MLIKFKIGKDITETCKYCQTNVYSEYWGMNFNYQKNVWTEKNQARFINKTNYAMKKGCFDLVLQGN